MQLIVYDEIHYLRDKERGVVWEESIILAPRWVNGKGAKGNRKQVGERAGGSGSRHGRAAR